MTADLPRDRDASMVRARNVGLDIAGNSMPILDGVSLDIAYGDFVALVGPSGSGKTTFLNVIAGTQKFTRGTVEVRGAPPQKGRRDMSYALARDALLPWRTAQANIELALQIRGVPRQERRVRARAALERVGLTDSAGQFRSQLSQGMRQRVALARAFVTEPDILLLDEPFAALDAQTRILMQQQLLELLGQFSGTVLMVTHDIAEAITLADRIIVFSRRPAQVLRAYDVDFPRPRDAAELRADPGFGVLFESIWNDIVGQMSSDGQTQGDRAALEGALQ